MFKQRKDWLIMTNNKLTNKKALEIAINAVTENNYTTVDFTTDEIVEKLEKILAQTEKKNSGERKQTDKQKKNGELGQVILEWLKTQTEGKTVTDMMKEIPELAELSNQKVSSIVKPLKDDGLIQKKIEKGRSYFFV